MNEIKIIKTSEQSYKRGDEEMFIIKPEIGSLLLRVKKNETIDYESNYDRKELFVVHNVDHKKRGVNKGIIDACSVSKVISFDDESVTYDSKFHPMYLFLTNHGKWFGSEQLKNYDFTWDPNICDVSSYNGIIRSPPIPIPIINQQVSKVQFRRRSRARSRSNTDKNNISSCNKDVVINKGGSLDETVSEYKKDMSVLNLEGYQPDVFHEEVKDVVNKKGINLSLRSNTQRFVRYDIHHHSDKQKQIDIEIIDDFVNEDKGRILTTGNGPG